jgi:hypothetical protein
MGYQRDRARLRFSIYSKASLLALLPTTSDRRTLFIRAT